MNSGTTTKRVQTRPNTAGRYTVSVDDIPDAGSPGAELRDVEKAAEEDSDDGDSNEAVLISQSMRMKR